MSALISGQGLYLSLGSRPILAGVDFAVQPGELVALIGPNGAGKTTLIKALLGLIPPDQGNIALNGRALAGVSPAERARALAYLPQGGEIHWPLTVERLVMLGRLPHGRAFGPESERDKAAVATAMKDADVTQFADRPVHALSGGERARVLIARVLAQETAGILADEPTANLDPYHQLAVMELLARRARGGQAVVVVLHDLTLAARFATRLVLMSGGRVLAQGPARDVLTPAHVAAAYGVEAEMGAREGEMFLIPWTRLEP